jgi:hypothetical protein
MLPCLLRGFIVATGAPAPSSAPLGGSALDSSVADPSDFFLPDLDPVPDPDHDHNKFSARFLKTFFLRKYAQKSTFMNKKVKQYKFLKYLWLLQTQKKFI